MPVCPAATQRSRRRPAAWASHAAALRGADRRSPCRRIPGGNPACRHGRSRRCAARRRPLGDSARVRGHFGQVRSEFPAVTDVDIESRARSDRCVCAGIAADPLALPRRACRIELERIEVNGDRTVSDDDIPHAPGKTLLDRDPRVRSLAHSSPDRCAREARGAQPNRRHW